MSMTPVNGSPWSVKVQNSVSFIRGSRRIVLPPHLPKEDEGRSGGRGDGRTGPEKRKNSDSAGGLHADRRNLVAPIRGKQGEQYQGTHGGKIRWEDAKAPRGIHVIPSRRRLHGKKGYRSRSLWRKMRVIEEEGERLREAAPPLDAEIDPIRD